MADYEKIQRINAICEKWLARLETKENGRFGRAVRLYGLSIQAVELAIAGNQKEGR